MIAVTRLLVVYSLFFDCYISNKAMEVCMRAQVWACCYTTHCMRHIANMRPRDTRLSRRLDSFAETQNNEEPSQHVNESQLPTRVADVSESARDPQDLIAAIEPT